MNSTEILAPAGSFESVSAAVNCGADAVYIGGKNFSARQNASNFNEEELKKVADFCHLHNVKLYMTVNTIILDSQTEEFVKLIMSAAKAGADAFIVQDLGAADIIRQIIPNACIHGSTQMTVHTVNGALFLKEKGFKRVVLSRELSEKQIAEICKLGIETEVFVHGALCMSLSGQCYLSSLVGQRSANRGLCAQPCRLPYTACENHNAAALSLKDLSLLDHLIKMRSLGISSFKIEGRMKRPEYVASAVMACIRSIDGDTPDMSLLKAVFSRNGFTDGYYTGTLKNMFGCREKEDVIAAAKILPEIRNEYSREIKTCTIHFYMTIKKDEPSVLTARCLGERVTVLGDVPQKALKHAVDIELVERQLSKLGGTTYDFGGVIAAIDEGLMLSAKSINSMRRRVIEKLNKIIIDKNTTKYDFIPLNNELEDKRETFSQTRMRISYASQLESVKSADFIIMPANEFLKCDKPPLSKIIVEPPRFIFDEKQTCNILKKCREKGAAHLMCNNISYIKTGKDLGFKLHGDFGLNIANSQSIEFLRKQDLEDVTLSFEMKLNQINSLKKSLTTGIIAYGYLPVMVFRNCPIKNEVGCKRCHKTLTDRTGRKNKIICSENYAELFNSELLYMADRQDDIKNVSFITLYFTDETSEEIADIINEYSTSGKERKNITRGLYYRGIL